MWKDPIYRFRIPHGMKDGDQLLKEVVMDVTLSAPNFPEPGKLLEQDVFTPLFDYLSEKTGKRSLLILDVGAGKLRNTLYLLEKGHSVCAVEYEKLKKESAQLQKNLEKARRFKKRFKRLTYPYEFIKSKGKIYDLAILINVTNIMPVPFERLFILQQCHQKLKQNGHLLWYTSYGQTTYKERFSEENHIGDGYYTGENRYLKAFFREYKDNEEVDEMLLADGFKFIRSFAVSKSKARLYRKQSFNLLRRVVSMSKIEKEITVDKSIEDPKDTKPGIVKKEKGIEECIPNPESLSLESIYAELLKTLPAGPRDASKYHRLVALILGRLFRPSLANFKIEEKIHQGRKRIDIVAANKSHSGFWHHLLHTHRIHCPFIMFECKNYKSDPKNPEFDQLVGRFSETRGNMGALLYRTSTNRKKLMQMSRDTMNAGRGYVLLFDDKDLVRMLTFSKKGLVGDLDNFLHEKWRDLVLG